MIEALLSRAKKEAQEAEVYEATQEETTAVFETNRLKHLETRTSHLLALRLTRDGRTGCALAMGGEGDLVARALEASRFGPPTRFHFPKRIASSPVPVYDAEGEKVGLEAMVGAGEEIIQRVLGHTPGLQCSARVVETTLHIRLLNSFGAEASYQKSYFGLEVEGVLVRGTDMLFVGDSWSSCHPMKDISGLAQEVIRQLQWASKLAPSPRGRVPVILSPRGVSSAFHLPLNLAFNGRVVLQGASPLAHRQGEMAFSPGFDLRDDATIPFRPHSRPWDDEGVASRRIPLVEKGVVAGFLYDLQTAGQAGVESTGSATRTMGAPPSPSTSSLVIGEGTRTVDEMIRDLKDGLLIEQLLGAEQGNVLGGDLSGNVLLGYKIEGGEVVGRVKDTMVSGNMYSCLKEGVEVGKGARWVGGDLHTPPILLSSLSVSTRS
jgi:PmbA protein